MNKPCWEATNIDDKVLDAISTYIPDYWEEHIEQKIETIHKRQAESGIMSSSFGLIADFHCDINEYHSVPLLERVMNECCIPYYFLAGDLFSGTGVCPKEKNIVEFKKFRRLFSRIESKCLIVEGNHDAVYSTFEAPDYYAQNIPLSEFYEHYFRFESMYPDRCFGETGTYYYVDIKSSKIRLVVLNTHDIPNDSVNEEGRPVYNKFFENGIGIMQKQLDWFAHVALDVPSPEWTVVVCTHEPPEELSCVGSASNGFSNSNVVLDIIDAFRRHSYIDVKNDHKPELSHYDVQVCADYRGRGGNFAVWVSGHTHCDSFSIKKGILTVTTINDSVHNSENSNYTHMIGTTTEQAFDIWTIDTKNHMVYATRVGCGEDREFKYTCYDEVTENENN